MWQKWGVRHFGRDRENEFFFRFFKIESQTYGKSGGCDISEETGKSAFLFFCFFELNLRHVAKVGGAIFRTRQKKTSFWGEFGGIF